MLLNVQYVKMLKSDKIFKGWTIDHDQSPIPGSQIKHDCPMTAGVRVKLWRHYNLHLVASLLPISHNHDYPEKGKSSSAMIQTNIHPINNDGDGSGTGMAHTEAIFQAKPFKGHF